MVKRSAWMNKELTTKLKHSTQELQKGASDAGGIQRHCPSVQKWGLEYQSPPGGKTEEQH